MFKTTLVLASIGALNWGLVALLDFNLVSALFGIDTVLTNLIYIAVAASAVYVLARGLSLNMDRQRHEEPTYRTA